MYLLDSDHISFLQLRVGREFATLDARLARQAAGAMHSRS